MRSYLNLVRRVFQIHKKYYGFRNGPLNIFILSKISYFFIPLFIYARFSANFITLINFILSIISIVIIFFFHKIFFISIIIYFFYAIFDFVDGGIARYYSKSTFFGKFIDGLSDIFYKVFFIFGLSFYSYYQYKDDNLLYFGLFSSILTCFDTFIYDRYSAITRWMNKDLKKNVKPYLKKKNYLHLKVFNFYSDIIFFLIILLLFTYNNHYLKNNLTLIFLFVMLSALHNITFHLFYSYKNLNNYSKPNNK